MKNIIVFYGFDNFLVNQAVEDYLKDQKLKEEALITSYYLAQENFEAMIAEISKQVNSKDLFNQKKVLIINDYDLVLNNNLKFWTIFQEAIINQFNQDVVIIVKFLSSQLNQIILKSTVTLFFIKNYQKNQLKEWVITKTKEYQINLNSELLSLIVDKFPNSLNIIDNELKKLASLNHVDQRIIEKFASKYFIKNPYRLINFWLMEDYQSFWWQYRNFWEKINYDISNLFNISIYQLELIRNIKFLSTKNFSYQDIITSLNISQIQLRSLLQSQLDLKTINQLLIRAHQLDFQVKTGKIAKNLAFDLFFCRN